MYKNKLVLLLMLLAFSASGVEENILSVLDIKADDTSMDLKNNILIYKSNVIINYNNIQIKSDQLKAHRRDKLGKNKELFVATGSPATFKGQLKDGSPVIASAQEIRYDAETDTVVFIGQAEIRQNNQSMSANVITYDHLQELITAKKDKNSDQRVHTVLTPVKNEEKEKSGNN